MKPALLLCLLLSAIPAYARLGETTEQIEARYGKPIQATKPESPATDAEVYEKNGFQITVGYFERRSCYEQFRKVDPDKPNSLLEITETERDWLRKANKLDPGFRVTAPDNDKHMRWQFYSSDRQSEGTYDSKVLTIRLLRVEPQKEVDEKKREIENLKGF